MTFPEFLLFLVFFSYCACYAFSLRKGTTVFNTASGNEIHIGKNGHYSVWHDGDGQIPFRITDLNGREAPLSKPLFHASFRRTGGRITLLKQGRLKTGFQTALLSAKCQSQQLNNFHFISLRLFIPTSPDSSKINKNNLIIRYKIKNWAARLPYSPSIYKQKLSTLEV